MGGLGYLIVNIGINQRFPDRHAGGVGLVVILSVIIDAALLFGQRRLTPWSAARGGRGRRAVIEFLGEVLAWYTDPAQWTGRDTLPQMILGQILLAATSLAVAMAIALPIGLYIGHTDEAPGSRWR